MYDYDDHDYQPAIDAAGFPHDLDWDSSVSSRPNDYDTNENDLTLSTNRTEPLPLGSLANARGNREC